MNKNYEFIGESDSEEDSDYSNETHSVNSNKDPSVEGSDEGEVKAKYKVFTYDYLLSTIVDYSNTKD